MGTCDTAIVGGPAGLATVAYAGRRGIGVVACEAEVFGQLVTLNPTKPVSDIPAQPALPSRGLSLRPAGQAELLRGGAVRVVRRRGCHALRRRLLGQSVSARG